jgi:endo-1,4-beta-xylanase
MPDELHDATLTREQALRVMKDHIETVVRHFRRRFPGTVIHWDVVNEAFDEDGTRADSKWQTWIGDDYIDWAFRFARRAGGPKLKLYLNEYFGSAGGATTCEAIPKCRAIRDQMLGMQQRGVPIDGLGIQAHLSEPDLPPLRALVDWIGDAGLQWAITELDAPARKEDGILGRRNQADQFRRATRTCVNDPACDTIVTWGMSDRYSWWGDRGVPDALHFDRKYRPKPAALALRDALRDAPRRRRRG